MSGTVDMLCSKTTLAAMVINLLMLLFAGFGSFVAGELLPETVSQTLTVSLNPLMPNDESSIKDCPYTNYPYAKRSLASSISAEKYKDKTFAHVVKLDTVDESCVGIVVDELHVLTTKQCALKEPKTISFHNETLPRWGVHNTTYHLSLDVALLKLKANLG